MTTKQDLVQSLASYVSGDDVAITDHVVFLKTVVDRINDDLASIQRHSAGLSEAESVAIKNRFKPQFRDAGYTSLLPPDLAELRHEYPVEWAEACQEWERFGAKA